MHQKQCRFTALSAAVLLAALSCGCSAESTEESYSNGYAQGYADGLADAEKNGSDIPATIEVKVFGDFTATVRELIPDYVYDSETPRAAVVTLFQDGPFVLRLDEAMCAKLQAGETYTFIVAQQDATLTEGYLYDDGNVSSDALMLHQFSVTDFRTPSEEEYGISCWRVQYTS